MELSTIGINSVGLIFNDSITSSPNFDSPNFPNRIFSFDSELAELSRFGFSKHFLIFLRSILFENFRMNSLGAKKNL